MSRLGTVSKRWASAVAERPEAESGVVVNGERLSRAEIIEFKHIAGLVLLEPGRYWLDLATGNMGFEGEAYPRLNVFHGQQRAAGNGPPAEPPRLASVAHLPR